MKSLVLLVALFHLSSSDDLVNKSLQERLIRQSSQRQSNRQQPGLFTALDQLRGRARLTTEDIQELYGNARAGQDYPNLASLPAATQPCEQGRVGFYADQSYQCQVVRRCDINGNLTMFLCPNMTVFNQITLVCDWFYNVDCSQAGKFYDYSNSRLYQGADVPLLDTDLDYDFVAASLNAVTARQNSLAQRFTRFRRSQCGETPSRQSVH